MHPDLLLSPHRPISPDRVKLMEKARELESAFLSEMLAHAGLGEASDSFGGGAGEEQFASFLRGEQARLIVDRGGIGLAETIFQSLVKSEEAHNAQ
ncbi:MAG: rod-binding protein [Paracoccaceae bacterium]